MNLKQKIQSFFNDVDTRGRERVTVMFVPHSQKKIKSFHISHYAIVITVSVVLLVSLVAFSMLTNKSMTETEKSYLTKKQQEYEYQLAMLELNMNEFLGATAYREELRSLFLSAGLIDESDEILPRGGGEDEVAIPDAERELINEQIIQMQVLIKELEMSRGYLDEIENRLDARQTFLDSVPNIWPLTPHTGAVINQFDEADSFENRGLTIDTLPGTPVRATANGTVVSLFYDPNRSASTVIIEHEYGFTTIYRGLGKVDVASNSTIVKGEQIGVTQSTSRGKSGFVYQIQIADTLVNPEEYISGKY